MLGNCAIGRPAIVTTPTITVTIAITMATIDEKLGHNSIACRRSGRGRDLDRHAIPDFLHALHHNSLAGFEALVNNPHGPAPLSHFDRAHADFVIAADHSYLVHALELRDCFLRYQQRRWPDVADEAHAAVLARPKDILGIRKQSGQTNGARLHINLTVGSKEFPLSRVCHSVSQNKVQHELSYSLLSRRHRRIALNEGEVLLLTYNEIGFDWIEL